MQSRALHTQRGPRWVFAAGGRQALNGRPTHGGLRRPPVGDVGGARRGQSPQLVTHAQWEPHQIRAALAGGGNPHMHTPNGGR